MNLGKAPGISQNLHVMRFFAAIMVIVSHAFILSTGSGLDEWFFRFSKGSMTMGGFAVGIFFLCGGYLIAGSVRRSASAAGFFLARAKRLMPPLIFVIFLSVIFGAFLTTVTKTEYLTSPVTYRYLLNCLFIPIHNLPGVFCKNPYPSAVNGSLWTLPVEVLCYIGCYAICRIGWLNREKFVRTVPLAALGCAALMMLQSRIVFLSSVILPCLLFYIGMGFQVFKDRIILNVKWMGVCFAALAVCFFVGAAKIGMVVFFPYGMFTVWFGIRQCPARIGRLGRYSYGVYLCGFPIGQTVVRFLGKPTMSPYFNMILAVPAAIIGGILVYLFAEKPFEKKRF